MNNEATNYILETFFLTHVYHYVSCYPMSNCFYSNSMSLGGEGMTSMDDAVKAAISRGIHFAVAAGNDNVNACRDSPARVYEA